MDDDRRTREVQVLGGKNLIGSFCGAVLCAEGRGHDRVHNLRREDLKVRSRDEPAAKNLLLVLLSDDDVALGSIPGVHAGYLALLHFVE